MYMYIYDNNNNDVISFNLVQKSVRKPLQTIIALTSNKDDDEKPFF